VNKRRLTPKDVSKAREVPIINVLESEGIKVIRRLDRWVCLSPISNEKNPSFYVYPENKFHDFSSGTGGDVIDLVRIMKALNFMDATRLLLNIRGDEGFDENKFSRSFTARKKSYGVFNLKSYVTSLSEERVLIDAYASSRGFDADTYLHCFYKDPSELDDYKKTVSFVRRLGVGFPHTDFFGNICGLKIRSIASDSFNRFNQRGKPGLYVLENIITKSVDPIVYIVEGETSAAAFYTYLKNNDINAIVISFGGVNQVPNSLPYKWEYLTKRKLIIDYDGNEELWTERVEKFEHLNAEPIKIETVKGEDLAKLSLTGEIQIYLQ
jgi:hypothetical protein